MAILAQSSDFYKEVKDKLGIPEEATSVSIHMGVDEIVTVDVTYNAEEPDDPKIKKRYALTELDDASDS